MAKSSKRLIISEAAKEDLEKIVEFGFLTFGEAQALHYLDSFDDTFHVLMRNPLLGKKRNEIRTNIRSFVHQSHLVFYDFSDEEFRVIRILHHSRDIPKAFAL